MRTFAIAIVLLALSPPAHAYQWMIRHGYTGCAMCHTDPSGAGLLTPYGRAQSDLLLRTRRIATGGEEEAAPTAGFLWGAVAPPPWLNAGGELRGLVLGMRPDNQSVATDLILMQADLQLEVRVGHFRANGSLGAVTSSESAASVAQNLVSREHWIGWSFDDDQILVRGGRIEVPFGIRSIEHTLYVRQATQTDINDTQEHGVAIAYSGDRWRGELLGILGNFQLGSDANRQRGYSGYAELAVGPRAAIGVSSLITHVAQDLVLKVADTRQAHGVMARVTLARPLVLLAEADLTILSPDRLPTQTGLATMVQLDYEPLQGLHLIGTGETLTPDGDNLSYGGWLGADWFLAYHVDFRVDLMRRSDVIGNTRFGSWAFMGQLHVFL